MSTTDRPESANGTRHRDVHAQREAFSSLAQIEAADRLAETLIVGFEQCEEAGRPLTERQKADLLSTALAAFDGYRAELESQLSFRQTLALMLGGPDPSGIRRLRATS